MACRKTESARARCTCIDGVWYRKTRAGLLMAPHDAAPRRHACRDCVACQHCSEERCRACRRRTKT